MKLSLPLYKHPKQVILVDDSASFVASLEFRMSPQLAIKSFANSVEALRWLFACYRAEQAQPLLLRPNETGTHSANHLAETDCLRDGLAAARQLYRSVSNPQRFESPAVVVVDYAMPQIDGIEFCRALEGLPCKKILLTGEADEMIAVDAFNHGLIDRYLKKGDPAALERLATEVAALESQYFIEKSAMLHDLLVPRNFNYLLDDAFVRLVHALTARFHFVEHFLFPDPSGILFFDAEGKASLMIVESRVGLASHLEAAEEYGAPEALCSALREHRVVPFFWPSGGMYTEKIVNWEQHCRPARLCEGRDDYYWAFFDLPPELLAGPVYGYQQFLTDREHVPLEETKAALPA
jgi:CheY-like chemotaxis protein